MSAEFVHLHNHSDYSLLDGMLRLTDVAGKRPSEFLYNVGKQKKPALAITDHGNMYGAMTFYFNALQAGVKPIIGCEVYHTLGSRKDKSGSQKDTGHLTILAKDDDGYKNLMKIVSDGFTEGFYYHPRIDYELLNKHKDGLIILSGCIASHVARNCAEGKLDEAAKVAATLRDIVGKENFYIEIMDHGIPEEISAHPGLVEIAKRIGQPLVATNDCHYEKKEDWEIHDARMCLAMNKVLSDPARMRHEQHELYFKSPEEMVKLFAHLPEAIKNTLVIAEKCNVTVQTGKLHLPKFDIPEKYHDESKYGSEGDFFYMKDLCEQGLKEKVPNAGPEYQQRLDFEMNVIKSMGFPSYFLIVRDFISYARTHDIPVGPGRGSAAGSLVAYTLDITRLDPLPNDLLFERFLNPDRISMPDIDVDFSDAGRDEVIEYARRKYGDTRVANIITYGTEGAKSAVKDVARVMEIPIPEVNAITKLIPDKYTLLEAINGGKDKQPVPELLEKMRDPKVKKMFDMAVKMEGLVRQTGIHASGVIVSPEEITNYAPLANQNNKHSITTQYDGPTMGDTDKMGMLKVDFLGLRTLSVISDAVKFIHEGGNKDFDIYKIPIDDKKTFDLLCEGKTICVFQLESEGMRNLVRALQPSKFSDISALVALYRPGPMEAGMLETFVERKHGRQKVSYDHPLLEPVLKDTYGTMLYQEQIMNIAKRMGGFTAGEADTLRKAMGKKKIEIMDKLKTKFVKQSKDINNVPEKLSSDIYDLMAKFAGYGFNKSHSAAYALVTYQVAYLKANYPVEFMAAAMTNEIGESPMGSDSKENKLVTYILETRDMGIDVLGPDINHSNVSFTIEKEADKSSIRMALTAVRNVGDGIVEDIVKEREKNGSYKSFEEFTMRVASKQLNKRCLEGLAKAGAFDCLYPCENKAQSRAKAVKAIMEFCSGSNKKGFDPNQAMLFGASSKTEETVSFNEAQILKDEYEFLGMYFSGHPLSSYHRHMNMLTDINISSVLEGQHKEKSIVRVAGMITQLKTLKTKKTGEAMAKFVLEDLTGSISVCCFPKKYQAFSAAIGNNKLVVLSGRVQISDFGDNEHYELLVEEVYELFDAMSHWVKNLVINLSASCIEAADRLKKIKHLLLSEIGECPVCFATSIAGERFVLETGLRVKLSDNLLKALSAMLGANAWKIDIGV